MNSPQIQAIRDLVQQGDLEQAADSLVAFAREGASRHLDRAITVPARLVELQRSLDDDLVKQDDFRVGRSQIRRALLGVLNDLERDAGKLGSGVVAAVAPTVDFLILTALEEERDAVLAKLPGARKLDRTGSDVHVYHEAELGTRRRDGRAHRIIVTMPAAMGPTQAAITATAAMTHWRPANVLLVGIAGGLEDEVALGDVIVARTVFDYVVGKVHPNGEREIRWEAFSADAGLLHAANALRTGWEDLVTEARPSKGSPARMVGVIASGGDVITSPAAIAALRVQIPKLTGVEMEGGGVAMAVHQHPSRPGFMMIRGVSDLADGPENAAARARFRAYARDVAAAYAIGLLREGR